MRSVQETRAQSGEADRRELRDRLGGLPRPIEAESIWNEIWHQETHNSTAIEGNTLVLREVRALLERGQALGSKQLKDYAEVKGYADAATWVYGNAIEPDDWSDGNLVNLTDVRHIHHLVMTPVRDVDPHPDARLGPDNEYPAQP